MKRDSIRPGTWIWYDDNVKVGGAKVTTGTRTGIVFKVGRRYVKIVTNGPRPRVRRVHIDDTGVELRPVKIKECNARITMCLNQAAASPTAAAQAKNAVKALRVIRDAARALKANRKEE